MVLNHTTGGIFRWYHRGSAGLRIGLVPAEDVVLGVGVEVGRAQGEDRSGDLGVGPAPLHDRPKRANRILDAPPR